MEESRKCLPILDWSSIDTLRIGNRLQQSALIAIETLGLKSILRSHSPQLIGDIALGIETNDPSLKIILSSHDLAEVEKTFKEKFWNRAALKVERKPINGNMCVFVSFTINNFAVRISTQTMPVASQRAYKIFRAQLKLLAMVGQKAITFVETKREKGVKSEWAVAEFFGLPGDPREALMKIDNYDEVELRAFLLDWKHGSKIEPEPMELTVTNTKSIGENAEYKIEMERPSVLFNDKLRRRR